MEALGFGMAGIGSQLGVTEVVKVVELPAAELGRALRQEPVGAVGVAGLPFAVSATNALDVGGALFRARPWEIKTTLADSTPISATTATMLTAIKPAAAGLRRTYSRTRSQRPLGRAAIGSPRSQRSRSSARAAAEA